MNNVNENKSGDNSLRDWFGKSRSSDGKPGWVQLGGKYAGKPCARQPGQTTKPKCGSSKMKRNLSKDEEERAFRRKNRKDPNPDRKGKAINVKTEELNTEAYNKGTGPIKVDVKKTMPNALKKVVQNLKDRENPIDKKIGEEFTVLPLNLEIPTNIRDFNLGLMFRESLDENSAMLFIFEASAKQSFHMKETKIPLDIAFVTEDGIIDSIKQLEPLSEEHVESDGEILYALEVNRGWFEEYGIEAGDEMMIEAAGEKDACYKKVKSRYKVWPSAYASGALVKCRKVGAANWGNSKKEEFDRFQQVQEKCWKGYKRVGMKKKGGKLVPNCVPEEVQNEGAAWTKKSGKSESGGLNEKGRKSYERENPGSDLKAPSKKVGNPRRASFCARMKGMKKKLTSKKTASDPDSRINKSLRAWNC